MRNDYSSGCFKIVLVAALVGIAFVAAGCSVTSLRCGVDGDISYVDLVNVPQDLASQARYFEGLCGFAYEATDSPGT